MWDKILEVGVQYGPFPTGIIVGIWIKRWSMGKYFASSEKEKESLREQIKHLHEIVSSKDDRIEKLHEQIKPTIGDKK